MMPESANPVQQPETVIEIRPFRGGWQCFERRVCSRIGLAKTRKKVLLVMRKRGRDLDAARFAYTTRDGSIQRVIPFGGRGNKL